MKILAIGDVHGDQKPLQIAQHFIDQVDRVIFLGDYVDSFHSKWPTQKAVLEDILNFKAKHPSKVSVLIGNHDLAYLANIQCSGHQNNFIIDIKDFFEKNFDLFGISYMHNNWIFSHAGISQVWWDNLISNLIINYNFPCNVSAEFRTHPSLLLNLLFKNRQFQFFNPASYDPSGDDPKEGPVWIRPNSLIPYGLKGWNQVVGHTEFTPDANRIFNTKDLYKKYPESFKSAFTLETGEIREDFYVFVDSSKRNFYSIIEDNKAEVHKLEN